MKILLIEDDILIGTSIQQALLSLSYTVDWLKDGDSALHNTMVLEDYSLVLLDLGLPGKDGLDVLSHYRQEKKDIPVIIITARDSINERVLGLDSGADDYLVKPFSLKELDARIRAVLRRRHGQVDRFLEGREVKLNTVTKEAIYKGQTQALTNREYTLLQELLVRPGAILSKEQLEERIYSRDDDLASNAIEFTIHSLRKKMGKEVIKNIRGLGWMVEKK